MKFGIVTFPGSNCDYDAYQAVVEKLGEEATYLWHKDHDLKGSDVMILPGGFSYGDYLRAGAIARFSPIMQDVIAFAKRGGPVLGSATASRSPARPACFRVRCCEREPQVRRPSSSGSASRRPTRSSRTGTSRPAARIPIAHGDGRYTADEATLDRLEGEGRVVFRYVGGPPTRRSTGARTVPCATSPAS